MGKILKETLLYVLLKYFYLTFCFLVITSSLWQYLVKADIIKTHDSESRAQEETGRTRRMSVLFTGSTGVKFVNALNKPPLKLLLSYQGLSTF